MNKYITTEQDRMVYQDNFGSLVGQVVILNSLELINGSCDDHKYEWHHRTQLWTITIFTFPQKRRPKSTIALARSRQGVMCPIITTVCQRNHQMLSTGNEKENHISILKISILTVSLSCYIWPSLELGRSAIWHRLINWVGISGNGCEDYINSVSFSFLFRRIYSAIYIRLQK